MEVWESERFLFRLRAGTPAPNLLKYVRELRGAGELLYPKTSNDARVGVGRADKPPFPDGRYTWVPQHAGDAVAMREPDASEERDDMPFFNNYLKSGSHYSKEPQEMAVAQLQIGRKADEYFFLDKYIGPLAANGRCKRTRCPISLVHPVFQVIQEALNAQSNELDEDDWSLYEAVVQPLAAYHHQEQHLVDALEPLLSDRLQLLDLSFVVMDGTTDGIIKGRKGSNLAYVEFKSLVGDASLQIARFVQQQVQKVAVLRNSPVYMHSAMPGLTLEIVGNTLVLGGTWLEQCVAMNELGRARFTLDASEQERRAGAAFLRAFFMGVKKLNEWYGALQENQYGSAIRRKSIPYPIAYNPRVRMEEILVPYKVFKVTVTAKDGYAGQKEGTVLIVKFVEAFRQDLYKAWSDAGILPQLYFSAAISATWTMLVMEYLSATDGWHLVQELDLKMQVSCKDFLMRSVEQAHAVTFKNEKVVHGDMKPSNIFVRLDGQRQAVGFKLIDTDWIGLEGKSRYTVPMNKKLAPGLPRPAGVRLGADLAQRHDLETLNSMIPSGTLAGGTSAFTAGPVEKRQKVSEQQSTPQWM